MAMHISNILGMQQKNFFMNHWCRTETKSVMIKERDNKENDSISLGLGLE